MTPSLPSKITRSPDKAGYKRLLEQAEEEADKARQQAEEQCAEARSQAQVHSFCESAHKETEEKTAIVYDIAEPSSDSLAQN